MKKFEFDRNKVILVITDILIITIANLVSKFLLINTFYFTASEWSQITTTILLSIIIYQIFLESLIYIEISQDMKMEKTT